MALNYVTITSDLTDASGAPVNASPVWFTPSATVLDSGLSLITPDTPIQAQIVNGQLKNAAGAPLTLLATDNTGLTVEGMTGFWYWQVSGLPGQGAQPFGFFLTHTPTTQDISTLTNSAVSGGFSLPAGDLGGTLASPTVAKIQGTTIAAPNGGLTAFLNATGTWTVPEVQTVTFTYGSSGAVPSSGTWTAGTIVVDQNEIVRVCTVSGSPGTWVRVLARPGQFFVLDYGAKGDGQVVIDGAITTATGALACATSTPFANATAGMPIHIGGAGGGTYAALCTTIATKTDSGHVTLAANATSTVSNAIVYFGTDDTTVIRNCVNAAFAYAQAHNGYAEVLFDPVMYVIGGAPVIGGSTFGNAQIPLPVNPMTTNQKIILAFKGSLSQSALNSWMQTTPQAAGTVLACARGDGTVDATYGVASVIGGPFAGYGINSYSGGAANVWNNMCPVIDGVGIMVPYNSSYSGFDFFGCAEVNVEDAACMAAATAVNGSTVPSMITPSNISVFGRFGLRMPSWLNNTNCHIGKFSCQGMVNGLRPSENTVWDSIHITLCWAAIATYSGASSTASHVAKGSYCWISDSLTGIYPLGSGDGGCSIDITMMEYENLNALINDSGNTLHGYLGCRNASGSAPPSVTGAASLRIIDKGMAPGAVGSPAAPPSSGVAFVNHYWNNLEVTVSVTGGTMTALLIDNVSQYIPASCVLWKFSVPTGHSYTPTYTGTLAHDLTVL